MRYQLITTLFAAIFIVSCEQKSSTEKKNTYTQTDSSGWYLQQLDALQKNGNNSVQQFVVKAGSKKIVQASRGFRVSVDPEKLETVSGKAVTGDIEVSIIEARAAEDFIANDIPTISGGRILESGGSYYIGMRWDNEELRIKKGQTLSIEMPRFSVKNMELFYGEKDSTDNFNWSPASQVIKMRKETDDGSFRDSIVATESVFKRIPYEHIKETDFLLMYADSVMNYRLDSICRNHSTISRDQEVKIMYAPIILHKGYEYVKGATLDHTVSVSPDYKKLNLRRYTRINDTLEIYVDSQYTVRRSDKLCNDDLNYYEPIEVTRMGWINCDKFYQSTEPFIPITLHFDPEEEIKVCKAYFIFSNINSCIAQRFYNTNGFLGLKNTMSFPRGSVIKLKLMTIIDGKIKMLSKEIKVEDNSIIDISFKENS